MSFSVEFIASVSEAERIVNEEYLPNEVKLFIHQGLRAYPAESLVRVKAVGHLFNRDYQRSSADIVIEQAAVRESKYTMESKAAMAANAERVAKQAKADKEVQEWKQNSGMGQKDVAPGPKAPPRSNYPQEVG